MASIIGGIAGFWINGVPYAVAGAIKYQKGGDTRATQMAAQGGIAGFTATANPGRIELDVYDRGDLDTSVINKLAGGTVTVELKSGKVIAMTEVHRDGAPIDIDLMSGKFTVTLVGTDDEVTA